MKETEEDTPVLKPSCPECGWQEDHTLEFKGALKEGALVGHVRHGGASGKHRCSDIACPTRDHYHCYCGRCGQVWILEPWKDNYIMHYASTDK